MSTQINHPERSIGFGDIWVFQECPKQFEYRKNRDRDDNYLPTETIGQAVKTAAVYGGMPAVIRGVEQELGHLPHQERSAHIRSLKSLVSTVRKMQAREQSPDVLRGFLYRWRDAQSGWELLAKPNEVDCTLDRNGYCVLKIVDDKNADYVKEKHRRQVYFFAMVLLMILDDPDQRRRHPQLRAIWNQLTASSIKLVVRLLRSQQSETFWFSPKRVQEQLDEVRTIIQDIEEAYRKQDFPATPSAWKCRGCNFSNICPASATRAARQDVPENHHLEDLSESGGMATQLSSTARQYTLSR